MIDIYETWIRDFGVDGFRIDTMKHVNDEFWQEFGPEVLELRAARTASASSSCSARSSTPRKSFTSHFTTHDKMQSVLDFPFQDAARNFASRGSADRRSSATFFADDDWYTDADSNVYELPTFLGNHDMGRIGGFVMADNPGAGDAEWVARDRLAHELMYFSRGNPVDLLRRRAGLHRHRRRPGRAADAVRQPGARSTSTTTCSAPTRRTRRTTSSRRTRCTGRSASWPR